MPNNLENDSKPGIQLVVFIVHQKERSSVSIDQLLCLVHDLHYEGVHADHLLEDGPEKFMDIAVMMKYEMYDENTLQH